MITNLNAKRFKIRICSSGVKVAEGRLKNWIYIYYYKKESKKIKLFD